MIHEPASSANYLNRSDITSILQKRIDAFQRGYRQNVGIVGREYMGKTSVLRQFMSSLPTQHFIPIYIEMVSEPFEYFVKKFMVSILRAYLASNDLAIPETFDALVKKARKFLPKTMKAMRVVKSHSDKGNKAKALSVLLSLTALVAEESKRKIVLLIDEFDCLEQFAIPDPFQSFSQEIMVQKDTMYVVTSSRPSKAEQIFREKLSLLFGNFESLELLQFSFTESALYIRNQLSTIFIDPTIVNFLIRLTDGHPYFLSMIVQNIKYSAAMTDNVVTDNVIIDVFTRLMFYREGAIYQHFLLELSPFNKGAQFYFYLNILLAVAHGHKKVNTIARFIERDKDETKKGIQRLLEEQIIKKTGHFYYIRDVLLRFWLRYVFQKKFMSLGVLTNEDEIIFRNEVYDLIDSACHDEKKELSKRVEELLRLFHNDVIELNDKKIKCPNFNEVYLRPTNGRVYPVYAKASNTRWLCQVARNMVDEDDVQQLIADTKKVRRKVNKRILITPYGISLNAKLLAKEAKIAIWNLRNLNFLLDLYDKPKVIIEQPHREEKDVEKIVEVIHEMSLHDQAYN